MNSDIPFNPIPIPDGLLLAENTTAAESAGKNPGETQTRKTARHRTRRRTRQKAPVVEVTDAAPQNKWDRIKGSLNARLAGMDRETLKRILTAAGVAAGIIIAILIAVKLTPIGLVLLGILGLAFLLRHWNQFFAAAV